MRMGVILGAGAALLSAGAAGAQHHGGAGAGYPQPGRVVVHGPRTLPAPPLQPMRQSRWGSRVDGRWWGGANAPGGWAAYRTPYRGYRLPSYWVSPRFYVTDWRGYGLTQPGGGYNWVRYYDDAVLVDGRGAVHDYRGGLDWDREEYAAEGGYERRERSGVGGAVAGAAVGGIVGNVVAGRGNRLGGTLIGAGVGAAAGLALDRATDPARRDRSGERRYEERRYDGRYGEPPVAPDRAPDYDRDERYEERLHDRGHRGPGGQYSADGRTVVTTTDGYGGGYAGGGYGTRSYSTAGGPIIVNAPYGSVTTVTVASAPVITTTTTTTEYYEDAVTYTRAPARRAYAPKRVYRAKVKRACVCR